MTSIHHFSPPRIVGTQYELGDDPSDVALCKEIGAVLSAAYPGWAWAVEIPPLQNVVIIRNLDCDPRGKMGMLQYKDRLTPGMREIVLAAGEFLERYDMRRTRNGFEQGAERIPGMVFEKAQT